MHTERRRKGDALPAGGIKAAQLPPAVSWSQREPRGREVLGRGAGGGRKTRALPPRRRHTEGSRIREPAPELRPPSFFGRDWALRSRGGVPGSPGVGGGGSRFGAGQTPRNRFCGEGKRPRRSRSREGFCSGRGFLLLRRRTRLWPWGRAAPTRHRGGGKRLPGARPVPERLPKTPADPSAREGAPAPAGFGGNRALPPPPAAPPLRLRPRVLGGGGQNRAWH